MAERPELGDVKKTIERLKAQEDAAASEGWTYHYTKTCTCPGNPCTGPRE